MADNTLAFVFPGQGSQKVGMLAAAHRPDLLQSVVSWTGRELLDALKKESPPNILDVRAKGELLMDLIEEWVNQRGNLKQKSALLRDVRRPDSGELVDVPE